MLGTLVSIFGLLHSLTLKTWVACTRRCGLERRSVCFFPFQDPTTPLCLHAKNKGDTAARQQRETETIASTSSPPAIKSKLESVHTAPRVCISIGVHISSNEQNLFARKSRTDSRLCWPRCRRRECNVVFLFDGCTASATEQDESLSSCAGAPAHGVVGGGVDFSLPPKQHGFCTLF